MTKSLGAALTEELYSRLSSQNLSDVGKRVIVFTTVDEDGWPRHSMLSHYEVVAKDRTRLLLLAYGGSRSTKNLLRNGKAVLLFVDEEMSLYVRVQCSRVVKGDDPVLGATREVLFEGKVLDTLEDELPTASILSGITFSGYDSRNAKGRAGEGTRCSNETQALDFNTMRLTLMQFSGRVVERK